MQAALCIGDIIEFNDHGHTFVDRISTVEISAKQGITYWLEQFDGTITDQNFVRLIERPSYSVPCVTWPSKYRSGQVVEHNYLHRRETGEIEEVTWSFSKTEKHIQYWINYSPVLEKDIICELDTRSTSSSAKTSESSSEKSFDNAPNVVKLGDYLPKNTK